MARNARVVEVRARCPWWSMDIIGPRMRKLPYLAASDAGGRSARHQRGDGHGVGLLERIDLGWSPGITKKAAQLGCTENFAGSRSLLATSALAKRAKPVPVRFGVRCRARSQRRGDRARRVDAGDCGRSTGWRPLFTQRTSWGCECPSFQRHCAIRVTELRNQARARTHMQYAHLTSEQQSMASPLRSLVRGEPVTALLK